jgi:sec-independent protein translocase protein TatB
MFDLSWSELMVVGVVGLVVIGPEELPAIVRNCKKIMAQIKQVSKEFTDSITEMDEFKDLKEEAKKLNEDIKTIVDLDGNVQRTYDISDIMPEIEKNKQKMQELDSNT